MPDYEGYSPGQILADASVADFIGSLGLSIAEAQRQLDENSLSLIDEYTRPRNGLNHQSLLQLGLSPAFYHYQYADLSCELDLRLKITRATTLGLTGNFSYNNDGTIDLKDDETSSSTSSGSQTQTEYRDANLRLKAAHAQSITINDKLYSVTGTSALEKIDNLMDKITADSESGIDAFLYEIDAPAAFLITSDAPIENVIPRERTVTFLGGEYSQGILRITTNHNQTYVLHNAQTPEQTISAVTTEQADLPLYAQHVLSTVIAAGFDAELVDKDPAKPVANVYFDTGKKIIRNATEHTKIRDLAHYLKSSNKSIVLEGFADRQVYSSQTLANSQNYNVILGNQRAETVRKQLVAQGVAENKIIVTPSRGQGAAEAQNPSGPRDDQAFRRVSMTISGRNEYWIIIKAKSGGENLSGVTPAIDTSNTTDNRFIFLHAASTLNLSAKKVTIDGREFPLRHAAINNYPEHSAEAYAHNLAADINAANAGYSASALQNVVTLTRDSDEFSVIMLSSSSKDLSIKETSGLYITKNFTNSHSKTTNLKADQTKKIAVGATVDARHKRSFEMEAHGNSKISARLVSIPAPPQFLEAIADYLATVGSGNFDNDLNGIDPFPVPPEDPPIFGGINTGGNSSGNSGGNSGGTTPDDDEDGDG